MAVTRSTVGAPLAFALLLACAGGEGRSAGAAGSGASSGAGGPTPEGGGGGSVGGGNGAAAGTGGGGGAFVDSGASVLTMHNHGNRDGLFRDSAFTRTAAAGIHLNGNFRPTIHGELYAQVLFYDAKGVGPDLLIAASERNEVTAMDAESGEVQWQTVLGEPASIGQFGCGNIDPMGITGTPVIDYPTRVLYVSAVVSEIGHAHHRVFAVSLDDGQVLHGWPVDMDTAGVFSGALTFDSSVQGERGGLLLLNDTIYIGYGGLAGDCGNYHGWIAAIPKMDPSRPRFWATSARGGGVWGTGGPATDGTRIFAGTGNTFGASVWQGGEAVISLRPAPALDPGSFFAPANWLDLDAVDADLGGSGTVLVDLPDNGAKLAVALGKDGNVYVLDREHLGGIGGQLVVASVATGAIINAPTAYSTKLGTYVVFRGAGSSCPAGAGDLVALRITASSVETAWCATQNGTGSPIATVAGDQVIVWGVGAEGDRRLHGFDGDTGAVIFAGGDPPDLMGGLNHLITPIVAKGRVYVGGSAAVFSFVLK